MGGPGWRTNDIQAAQMLVLAAAVSQRTVEGCSCQQTRGVLLVPARQFLLICLFVLNFSLGKLFIPFFSLFQFLFLLLCIVSCSLIQTAMLRRKETYTVVTPIPGFIPRQLAIDILHSHSEVITVNPLVLDHKPIPAPQNAAADEYYSSWYEITERIQYVPGTGKIGSGQIKFNGCFHNMPWGLQTHTYVPLGIELKNKFRIAGNQPGIEPPEQYELGNEKLNVPKDGLYLRQETEIKCNITLISFVKSQLKAASKEMVARIIKKAELLDKGELQAMMENGKIRTINPNDRTMTGLASPGFAPGSGPDRVTSPTMSSYNAPLSPNQRYAQPAYNTYSPYGRPESASPQPPQQMYYQSQYPTKPGGEPIVMELPGDAQYHAGNPAFGSLSHSVSTSSAHHRQSLQPDPNRVSVGSYTSNASASRPAFSAELPAHNETRAEQQ